MKSQELTKANIGRYAGAPTLKQAAYGRYSRAALFKDPIADVLKTYELVAAATDTSTSNISEVQGTLWQTDVMKFGEALRRADQAVTQDFTMVGTGDKTLTIPKTTSHLDIDIAKSSGEGDVRDLTEITQLDTVSITLAASDFKQGEIRISKEIALTSRVNLVSLARYLIAQDMAQDLDTAIIGITDTDTGIFQDTNVTNQVYGGDATTPAGLATGDVFTTDLVADAMDLTDANDFPSRWLFIHPKHMKFLRKDSQFVNAAEYGGREVIQRGEIGDYLGNAVITTTNCPAYDTSTSDANEPIHLWGAAGHPAFLIAVNKAGQKAAGTIAWKERPKIDFEYDLRRSSHRVYYDQTFKVGLVFKEAITIIKATDA